MPRVSIPRRLRIKLPMIGQRFVQGAVLTLMLLAVVPAHAASPEQQMQQMRSLVEILTGYYKLMEEIRAVAADSDQTAVLQMARANGVPAEDIYEFDASKQTTRVSASVSGLFGTAAVRLNDNLLRRASQAEIRAVMGHELGHYVMNHALKLMTAMTLVLLVGFYFGSG